MRAPSLDPEAVADPIRGSLELSRIVGRGLPLLLGAILLSALFTGGWLVLLAGAVAAIGVDFVSSGSPALLAQLFLLALPLWLAVLALGLLLRSALFFRGFSAGHITVERAGEMEPGDGEGRGAFGRRGAAGAPNPALAVLSLARAPTARAGEVAGILRLMAVLFVPLLFILAADAMLLLSGGTLLWRSPPDSGPAVDAVLLLLGLAALAVTFFSEPLLGWVALRLNAIREVERSGPVRVPAGATALERYLRLLQCDGRYRAPLEARLRAGEPGAVVAGASGNGQRFDLYMELPGGTALGRQRSFFLRLFARPPTMGDLEEMERAVADVCAATGNLPSRAVLLHSPGVEGAFLDDIEDRVYERLMERPITGRAGWTAYACAIELVSEQPDGTYDFVPFKFPGG